MNFITSLQICINPNLSTREICEGRNSPFHKTLQIFSIFFPIFTGASVLPFCCNSRFQPHFQYLFVDFVTIHTTLQLVSIFFPTFTRAIGFLLVGKAAFDHIFNISFVDFTTFHTTFQIFLIPKRLLPVHFFPL